MKILAKIPHRNRSYLLRKTVSQFLFPSGSVTLQTILPSNTLINYKEMKNETENWGGKTCSRALKISLGIGHVSLNHCFICLPSLARFFFPLERGHLVITDACIT